MLFFKNKYLFFLLKLRPNKRNLRFAITVLLVSLLILQNLLLLANPVYALNRTWGFTDSSDYSFDNDKISVSSNVAQLRVASGWYDTNWAYRKQITINNTSNSSALTNYQVKVNLTSSNFDFSKAQAEGEDIRFADDNGTSLLKYWFESYDSSSQSAIVWIKVPSISASSSKTIYLYYGNGEASDAQDGSNTFIFLDDFTGIPSTKWNRHPDNPLLASGQSAWEASIVGDPWVIYDSTNSVYRMWYYAYDGSRGRMGYATSEDGVDWDKYPGNPIMDVGVPGSYDDLHAHKASVVFHDNTYFMYYSAQKNGGARSIALATASNPEGPYTKYVNNPILSPLASGYENNFLDTPSVLYDSDEDIWKMWYSCGNIMFEEPKNWCYATSSDGYSWTKYGSNPIAVPPNDGSWLSQGLGGMDILKIEGVYHNYYNAFDNGNKSRIGYTTSSDGLTWALKSTDKIMDLGSNSWENSMVYRPNVQIVDGVKMLWYNAKGSTEQIGLATLEDDYVLDSSKWTESLVGSCSISIESGSLVIDESGGGDGNICTVKTANYNAGNNVVVETRSRIDTVYDSNNAQTHYMLFLDNTPFFTNTSNTQLLFSSKVAGKVIHQSRSGGSWGSEDEVFNSYPTTSTWYRATAIKKENGIDWYFKDDNENILGQILGNNDSPTNFTNYPIAIGSRGVKNSYDWFRARAYTSPEPTTLVGSEANPYPTDSPDITLVSSESLSFSYLSGFEEMASKNGGEIKYQLSSDSGTNWYWWDGSSWAETTSRQTEASLAGDINSNISSLPTGTNNLIFKAYLISDGSQQVSLSAVNLTYSNSGPTVTSVTSTPTLSGATINWTTDRSASTKVDYGLTDSYGSTTAESDTSTRVTSHTASLSSLSACTTYHYRVRSIDSATNEIVDNDRSFTTLGCTGSASVTRINSSQIMRTAGGTVILHDGNSHGITLYIPTGFAANDANFQAHQLEKTKVLETTSNPGGYSVAGDYIYELGALTDVSTSLSSFSQPITVKISYSNQDINGLDESALKIWRYDGSSWNMLSECSVDTSAKTVTCSTANFSIFGLFGIKSTDSNKTESSNTSTPNNTNEPPGCSDQAPGAKAPWLYGAIQEDSQSVRLYFTAADSPVTKYVLKYGTKPGEYPYGSPDLGINLREQMTYLVKSLAPNTKYYFRVRASNGCQPGAWSNEISATTKAILTAGNLDIVSSDIETISNPETAPVSKEEDKTEQTKPTEFSGYDVKISVKDTNNKPIEGVKVTLHSKIQEAVTDINGIALFHGVEQGDHKVLIAHEGYRGEESINLTGDVKEFDLNIKVESNPLYISPLATGLIGVLVTAVGLMAWVLVRIKRKE